MLSGTQREALALESEIARLRELHAAAQAERVALQAALHATARRLPVPFATPAGGLPVAAMLQSLTDAFVVARHAHCELLRTASDDAPSAATGAGPRRGPDSHAVLASLAAAFPAAEATDLEGPGGGSAEHDNAVRRALLVAELRALRRRTAEARRRCEDGVAALRATLTTRDALVQRRLRAAQRRFLNWEDGGGAGDDGDSDDGRAPAGEFDRFTVRSNTYSDHGAPGARPPTRGALALRQKQMRASGGGGGNRLSHAVEHARRGYAGDAVAGSDRQLSAPVPRSVLVQETAKLAECEARCEALRRVLARRSGLPEAP